MHGTFDTIGTKIAFDPTFDTFIGSLYANGTLPPVLPIPYIVNDDAQAYFKSTGRVPVLTEDEEDECPVFGNWGTYYEFEGWLAYRAMSGTGNEFQLMVTDVLNNAAWSPETVQWIGIINGLVNVQEKYADKFGHYPPDLNKFIKSYIKYGEATVLSRDVY